jgi:hypothetical protein
MQSFEGYLERVEQADDKLVLRFLAGDFDPCPSEAPVFWVAISNPHNAAQVCQRLRDVMRVGEWSYVAVAEKQAVVTADHGEELTITGEGVACWSAGYEDGDYKALARKNYDWGQSQYQAWRLQLKRFRGLRELVDNQYARVAAKAVGHEVGSTARTLYEQHLTFLARLLRELDGREGD